MIDKLAEIFDVDRKEIIQGILFSLFLLFSLVAALAILGGWVALVIYTIMPLNIDTSGYSIPFLRFLLAFGGGFAIVFFYCMVIHAVAKSN